MSTQFGDLSQPSAAETGALNPDALDAQIQGPEVKGQKFKPAKGIWRD